MFEFHTVKNQIYPFTRKPLFLVFLLAGKLVDMEGEVCAPLGEPPARHDVLVLVLHQLAVRLQLGQALVLGVELQAEGGEVGEVQVALKVGVDPG